MRDRNDEKTYNSLEATEDNRDAVTGLLHIDHFFNCAETIQQCMPGEEKGITCIFFLIENFRYVSEKAGFEDSNQIIKWMGQDVFQCFSHSLCARYGRDSFVVLTQEENVEDRVRLIHDKLQIQSGEVVAEVKTGLYILKNTNIHPSEACDYARFACESIRHRYDRIFCYYDDVMDQTRKQREYIIQHIDSAIEQGHIVPYYQPVICGDTQHIVGAEALARWKDPHYGLMSPQSFIVTLEDAHLIDKLDFYIIELVCRDYASIRRRASCCIPISVNLSRVDFEQHDIWEQVEHIRTKYGVPKDVLRLEITERSFKNEESGLWQQVRKLRNKGYHVWMDDFGSGMSSLSLLHELDFDLIKFDLHFLIGKNRMAQRRIIMTALIDMVKRLGVKTLAEGVETEEQYQFLQDIGCEHMQGYYFSKPVPLEEFLSLL